jgi:hypothetical protein
VSRQGNRLRGGVLHVEELPMAASRGLAYQMMLDAGRDVELAGQLIPAESYVALTVGAANHDTAEFADPAGWPAALIGLDHLPLVYGTPARDAG